MNNQQWIDILPPIAPGETISTWLWLCLIGLFLILLTAIYLWHNSNRQKSLRTLKILRNNLQAANDLDSIPLQLSHAIKLCFSVNNLNHISMPEQDTWNNFRHKLITMCFSKEKPQQPELEKLLLETRYWLKQQATKNV